MLVRELINFKMITAINPLISIYNYMFAENALKQHILYISYHRRMPMVCLWTVNNEINT